MASNGAFLLLSTRSQEDVLKQRLADAKNRLREAKLRNDRINQTARRAQQYTRNARRTGMSRRPKRKETASVRKMKVELDTAVRLPYWLDGRGASNVKQQWCDKASMKRTTHPPHRSRPWRSVMPATRS